MRIDLNQKASRIKDDKGYLCYICDVFYASVCIICSCGHPKFCLATFLKLSLSSSSFSHKFFLVKNVEAAAHSHFRLNFSSIKYAFPSKHTRWSPSQSEFCHEYVALLEFATDVQNSSGIENMAEKDFVEDTK